MQWTESVGLTLVNRDLTSMQLKTPGGHILTYYILQIFPFTSESKRMGIIVRVIWWQAVGFHSPKAVFNCMFILIFLNRNVVLQGTHFTGFSNGKRTFD